jgi:hypothetical protein
MVKDLPDSLKLLKDDSRMQTSSSFSESSFYILDYVKRRNRYSLSQKDELVPLLLPHTYLPILSITVTSDDQNCVIKRRVLEWTKPNRNWQICYELYWIPTYRSDWIANVRTHHNEWRFNTNCSRFFWLIISKSLLKIIKKYKSTSSFDLKCL